MATQVNAYLKNDDPPIANGNDINKQQPTTTKSMVKISEWFLNTTSWSKIFVYT